MSLSTVLKIGKIYRNSAEYGLDEHRYINKTSSDIDNVKKNKDEDKKPIETTIFTIPVRQNTEGVLTIFLNEKKELKNEDAIKCLRNLNYKTSDKDKSKKFIFGDIVYSAFNKKGVMVEGGNYRMAKGKELSSFHRGKGEVAKMSLPIIGKFHKALEAELEGIEKLMMTVPSIVLHFDFEGKNWFELEDVLDSINKKLISEFIAETTLPNGRKVVALAKSLFKTIKPPLYDSETGIFKDPDGVGAATPGFRNSDSYKIHAFETADDVIDLLYAVKTSESKMVIQIKGIGIIALPNNENLTALQLNNFYGSKSVYDETEEQLEEDLQLAEMSKENEDQDSVFAAFENNDFEPNTTFDIVFIKPKGLAAPSIDLIEISNLQKSHLRYVHENIRAIKRDLKEEAEKELSKIKGFTKRPELNIRDSFQKLLDNHKKDQKKYQSHILKVLPQIYNDSYYSDPMLIPLFIEQVEYGIRNGGLKFNILKYELKFLMFIQKKGKMNLDTLTESTSFQLGRCLGVMSKPLGWSNTPIKSFEKSYVGNISRRIGSPIELLSFTTFLNQKLTIHGINYREQKAAFVEFMRLRKEIGKEQFNKEACAYGFFEGYNSPKAQDTEGETAE
jgi:hypothetical protein